MSAAGTSPIRVRSVFLSDIHLGTRECQAGELLAFLATVEAEHLYLVGDVIDLWSMRRRVYWPAAHQQVLQTLIAKARQGTRVLFIPGNHDDLARSLCGSLLAGIEVHREFVHVTASGQRLLVVHGDDFDGAVRFSPVLKLTGDLLYTVILLMSRTLNAMRRLLGLPRWSLATWIKSRVGKAVDYVRRFEDAASHAAAARGFDGVICGHIHRPCIAQRSGVLYCNDGDWVEHCTALIEDRNGELRLWERPPCSDRVLSFPATVAAAGR
jgi:UDP-2,3-diacylglucosamine pyrophosphatase LpxH